MAADDRATRFDDEIAEIEDRRGKRNLFMILGGLALILLVGIVVIGARERARIADLEARPQTEPVELGELVGRVGSTALYAEGENLYYVEGVPQDVDLSGETSFVRQIEYSGLGEPDVTPPGTTHWSIVRTDSLPFVVERIANPLTGVNPVEFREVDPGALRSGDYRSGGSQDWYSLEQEGTAVRVTGRAAHEDDAAYLIDDPSRVRLQGLEGLSTMDSLEFAWAASAGATITGYGRISSTPPGGDPLFILVVSAIHPPTPVDTPAAADTTAAAADTAAADTTASP